MSMRIVSCSHAAPQIICATCLMSNLKLERLSIDEALARIAFAKPAYDSIDAGGHDLLEAEGWAVFNLPDRLSPPDGYLGCGIERFDDDVDHRFADDVAAERYVAQRAAEGSAPHLAALFIQGACNSIRAITWGEDWVDSRCGPDNRSVSHA